jgi:hypothetical protein
LPFILERKQGKEDKRKTENGKRRTENGERRKEKGERKRGKRKKDFRFLILDTDGDLDECRDCLLAGT